MEDTQTMLPTPSNSFRFQRERSQDVFDEVMPLLELHWREIAHYQDIPLSPNFKQYAALEDAGLVRTFTARDSEKKLVGYAVFFVRHNLHYQSSLQASQDILFIHPDKRGFGARFILWCDRQLKEEGVAVVYHHIKVAHNFGKLLERMGYEMVDLIYAKRLDREGAN